MSSKYKLKKDHGFNPFKNKLIQSLNLHMNKHHAQNQKQIDCREFAIIINNNHIDEKSQTDKKGAFIYQHMEMHEQKCQQTQSKKLIMFNEREYSHKEFRQIYYSNQIKQNPTQFIKDFCTKSNLTNERKQQQQKNASTSKLIIYLSNKRQFSQQLIIGHNQNSQANLLGEIFSQMQEVKNRRFQLQKEQNSQIYFSAIGIKKQNQLYDLLNDRYLENQHINGENDDLRVIPKVRVRKIGIDIDSVSAQNLIKQPVQDEQHFTQLIEKSLQIKNHIQSFHNFNQPFLIGEVYHFFQANQTFDIMNETVFIKVNQSLVNEVNYEDGFYQRRMKEDNTSKVASLLMRMGLNVKNCRKNRSIMQAEMQNTSKLSKMQMHQSKILLYLSPLFCNPKTSYILVNQIDPKLTIQEILRKLQLNKNFVSHKKGKTTFLKKPFCYVKHYLDNQNVLAVVKRLAAKFIPNNEEIANAKNDSNLFSLKDRHQHKSEKKNISSSHIKNNQKNLSQIIKQMPILSQRSHSKSEKTNNSNINPSITKKKYNNEKIKSKSFFSQTIISAQRNYLKFRQRQNRKHQKLIQQKNQNQIQGMQEQQYFSKTINQRVQNLKFVQDNYLTSYKPIGIRISYKRKMVVKKAQAMGNFSMN